MRLKELTQAVVEELEKRLKDLEGKEIHEAFLNPNFPHLNSTISGSVENQSTPTWYTLIHDSLEHIVVEYSKEDIEAGRFLNLKVALSPEGLDVYLMQPGIQTPAIRLQLAVEVLDIQAGSFRFATPIIQQLQISRDYAAKAIA